MYLQIIATFCEIYQKLLFSGYGVKLVSYEDIHRHPILQRILNIQFKTRKMSRIWAPTTTHEDEKLVVEILAFFKQKPKTTSITFFACITYITGLRFWLTFCDFLRIFEQELLRSFTFNSHQRKGRFSEFLDKIIDLGTVCIVKL